ncbi:MAG: RNA 3'-terminal phosphate cyclase [Xanthomonas sp.]
MPEAAGRVRSVLRRGAPAFADLLPIESEPRQIFAQAVGVVGAGALRARDGEQFASGLRQRLGGGADPHHLFQLHAVETVQLRRYLDSGACVSEHLADQLLLPMALAGGGAFVTDTVSAHLSSNARLIEKFLPVEIAWEQVEPQQWRVVVSS